MAKALSQSRLISVSVTLATSAATMQNTNTLLLMGTSDVIDLTERYREYSSLEDVATDLGTASPEYAAALLYYQQSPQPTTLFVGRWASAATKALLRCATLTASQQVLTLWTAVTSGGFKISVDGVSKSITGINLSSVTSLSGVAAAIQARLVTLVAAGVTCTWDANYSRFQIEGATTGATATLSLLTAPDTDTDLSVMMAGTVASSGAYVVAGSVAETPLTATTVMEDNFGQKWYGLSYIGATDDQLVAVAGYIEGLTTKHILGISTQDTGTLVAGTTTDIASRLKALSYNRSFAQYSSSTPYSAVSFFGRFLTVDYTGNSTVITMMYQDEPGITAELLTSTQATALKNKNCNVFVEYDNDTAIVQYGTVASGEYVDTITGSDWLALDIQSALFTELYGSKTKIPQTDAGNNQLKTAIEKVCAGSVTNGFLAAGTWTTAGFGSLSKGDYLAKGYYVYAPLVAEQSDADRTARKSVAFQVAAKCAGAIHTVDIAITVNA